MRYILSTILATTSVALALPVGRRQIRIDEEAVREAQRKDETATRAFTAVPIRTSSGQCLTIDESTGDFRLNLQSLIATPCTGAANQQFDIITAGQHNDRPGTALIVSSSVFSCLNFDSRRAPGNQVITFSCGGRADGGGQVTDSQLFEFANSTETSLPLAPINGRGEVCLKIVNGKLDQSSCQSSNPSVDQVFTIGDADPTPAQPSKPEETEPVNEPSASPEPPQASEPPAAPTGSIQLDPAATTEAQQRDNGATRAFSNVPIKTSDGKCLEIDVNSGDFRRNLMLTKAAECTGSATQQFDFITSGLHNNQPGTTLIVSSAFSNCLNFDARRAPGNQVILFSCGGRADGGGQVTDSQLFSFPDPTVKSLALAPVNGRGSVCLSITNDTLDQSACDVANPATNQIFTIGDGTTSQPPAEVPEPTESSTETNSQPTAVPPAQPSSAPSKGSIRLDDAATAEAQQRDNGATRAFTASQIKTSEGKCLTVNLDSGDFRQNLMETTVEDCVAGLDTQQFDLITAGKHNNVAGQTLIVSSLTNGCLNVDERRQPGNQVILFSCGGRADGSGETTNSQLFAFDGQNINIALVPANVQNGKCITAAGSSLEIAQCDPTNPDSNQTFTIA